MPIKKKSKQIKAPGSKKSSAHLEIESLVQLMEVHGLTELEWQNQKERFRLIRANRSSVVSYEPREVVQTEPSRVAPPVIEKVTTREITAPLVGTFYRAASPGASPFAQVGSTVKSGDVLCIIEAMKLMNEIESDFDGKIVSVLVENGQPVEFGEPLFLIEPS